MRHLRHLCQRHPGALGPCEVGFTILRYGKKGSARAHKPTVYNVIMEGMGKRFITGFYYKRSPMKSVGSEGKKVLCNNVMKINYYYYDPLTLLRGLEGLAQREKKLGSLNKTTFFSLHYYIRGQVVENTEKTPQKKPYNTSLH